MKLQKILSRLEKKHPKKIDLSLNRTFNLLKKLENPKIGAVTGRPVSISQKNKMLGYWSHLLTDVGAHKTRLIRTKQGKFILVSGYLFAMRNSVITDFPIDASEDAVIPYLFWKKNFKKLSKVYLGSNDIWFFCSSVFGRLIDQCKSYVKLHNAQ